jgi:chemotaxis protein MotB
VTIIVRHEEGEEPTHRNGAWKVAYADFVTAMMAFFMLMWLLNATTEVQRTGLADYFAPTNLFGRSASGSGKPFGGKTPNDAGTSVSSDGSPQIIKGHQSPQQDVAEADTDTPATPLAQSDATTSGATDGATDGASRATTDDADQPARMSREGRQEVVQGGDYAAARLTPDPNRDIPPDPTAPDVARREAAAIQSDAQREQRAMEQAGAQLLAAIRRDPSLQDEAGQITVDTVPEGLRIQVVDAERRPMFALGSASPTRQVRQLMQKVAPVLAGLPNAVSIAGHTDSLLYRGQEKDNWDLSTDRANATRRILVEAGLPAERIRSVTGNADRDLLVPADPLNPANRRITVIVLRHAGRDRPRTAAAAAGPTLVTAAPAEATPATTTRAAVAPAAASAVTAASFAAAPATASAAAAMPATPSVAAVMPATASAATASAAAGGPATASAATTIPASAAATPATPAAANPVTR